MKPSFSQLTTFLLLTVGAVLLSSCVSVHPVPPNTPPIILDQSYTRNTVNWMGTGGAVIFPAGVYQPDFQTDKGIYYRAPTSLISGRRPLAGGLFIPKSQDGNQACWFVVSIDSFGAHPVNIDESIPYHQEAALGHDKNSQVKP